MDPDLEIEGNEWEEHFATLDEQDRKDPIQTIFRYCTGTPFKMRSDYFEIFAAAMYSPYIAYNDPTEYGDMMSLLKSTLKLVEAACLINKLIEEERLTYSIKETA
ncbi:MAG TPA: hypothetical protein VGM30_08970 [Puia sp.]|jgi:hypothetical protein